MISYSTLAVCHSQISVLYPANSRKFLLMNGQWAGEECIKAAADFLKNDIHLYVFVANISPTVNSPATDSARHQPIAVVFYEPGHYCSVSSSSGRMSLNAPLTSLSSATSSEPTGEQSLSALSSVSSRNAPLDAPPSSPSSTSSFSQRASSFEPESLSLQCSPACSQHRYRIARLTLNSCLNRRPLPSVWETVRPP